MGFMVGNVTLWMRTKLRKKMSQQKEEFHSITLEQDLIRVDEEVLEEVKDVEDLVKEAKE
jgi:hypothetical protein